MRESPLEEGMLVVDQDCAAGHRTLNKLLLACLRARGPLRYVTSAEYAQSLGVEADRELRGPFLRAEAPHRRIAATRGLARIIETTLEERPSTVFFAGFDPLAFPMLTRVLPSRLRLRALVHNQVEWARSPVRRLLAGQTSRRVAFLTFAEHIAIHLRPRWRSAVLPHPFLADPDHTPDVGSLAPPLRSRGYVFAPSRSNDAVLLRQALRRLQASEYLLCRSPCELDDARALVRAQFENYGKLLQNARAVFVARRFSGRVSGVAYDALGSRTPLVLPRSPFAAELQRSFPRSVHILEDVPDFAMLPPVPEEEHRRFVERHGPDSFCRILRDVLDQLSDEGRT